MRRLLTSLLFGLVIGSGSGLALGWGPFAAVSVNNPATSLADTHKETYTIMVAAGYVVDGDRIGAVNRLRILGIENAPEYVREMTERYITLSRDVEDIRLLVALYEGLASGQDLPGIMQPYRMVERQETP